MRFYVQELYETAVSKCDDGYRDNMGTDDFETAIKRRDYMKSEGRTARVVERINLVVGELEPFPARAISGLDVGSNKAINDMIDLVSTRLEHRVYVK